MFLEVNSNHPFVRFISTPFCKRNVFLTSHLNCKFSHGSWEWIGCLTLYILHYMLLFICIYLSWGTYLGIPSSNQKQILCFYQCQVHTQLGQLGYRICPLQTKNRYWYYSHAALPVWNCLQAITGNVL